MRDHNHTAGRIARRIVLALGLALITVSLAAQPISSVISHAVDFDGLSYLADSLYLRIVNRIINPAELRLESKLDGDRDLDRGVLTLRDVDAPGILPNRASATATLYYRSGEERTIETTLHKIWTTGPFGAERNHNIVGIEVPEDDKAAYVPTYEAIRFNQLVRVVVIVPRPSAGW